MNEETDLFRQLEDIKTKAFSELEAASDETGLQAWRTAHLGRNAPVMLIFSRLSLAPKELRPQLGQGAN
ncbi:MAG: phenylalanine--tRNA ligase subunit alpha, partial [Anaerolineaceae bacterium]|nr:phenylalanine--tRNA ligase subunit alpha [Anaerolineaceae bacterium]